jgi:hypothetical protein
MSNKKKEAANTLKGWSEIIMGQGDKLKPQSTKDNSKWVKVGEIGVDAGMVWIGDPCYILHTEEPVKGIGKDWGEFCDLLPDNGPLMKEFDGGLGCVVGSGDGDGCYDVRARVKNGRVYEVKVVFIRGR